MADLNYVPQVDYTSRDYLSIRDDMLALIPLFAPQWTNRDPADFGIALVQMFASMGDNQSYYVDRAANEAFISTASKRSSILRHAALLDYQPTQSSPALVTLTFSNSTGSAIVVPAGTQVATSTTVTSDESQLIFETNSSVTVPPLASSVAGTINVIATQGYTTDPIELVQAQSTGQPNQFYQLAQSPVLEDSVIVTVDSIVYEKALYLIDVPGTTPAFSVFTDADDITYIQFGDNIGGKIPPLNKSIYAEYRIGGGAIGNVPAGSITDILTNYTAGLTVTNQSAAAGGEDAESTDSIKINAPSSIKSLNRAVSISDYAALTLQVPGLAKSIATSETYASIIVYFAPFGDRGVEADNITPTSIFNTLATTVSTYLQGKAPANTSVTLAPPSYVPIDIKLSVTMLPQYRQSSVQAAILTAIAEILAFESVLFADRISLQYLMRTIGNVPGVDFTEVRLLRRADAQQQFNINNKAITSNVATLTTTAAHNLTLGQTVVISNIDSTFNGTYIVSTVPSNTTFTYAKPSTGNVVSVAITPALTVSNKALTSNVATLTTTAPHGLVVGQVVTVASVASPFNGKFTVVSVPSTTTFTYRVTGTNANVGSAASGGTIQLALAQALVVEDVVCAINEIPEAGLVELIASGGITN